jgi:hypothetical protein
VTYVAGELSIAKQIFRLIGTLIAVLAAFAAAFVVYFWWAERLIEYAMTAGQPSNRLELVAQQEALSSFQQHGACEHIGTQSDWDDRPTLLFSVHSEYEKDDVRCIQGRMPTGFRLLKKGRVWW